MRHLVLLEASVWSCKCSKLLEYQHVNLPNLGNRNVPTVRIQPVDVLFQVAALVSRRLGAQCSDVQDDPTLK